MRWAREKGVSHSLGYTSITTLADDVARRGGRVGLAQSQTTLQAVAAETELRLLAATEHTTRRPAEVRRQPLARSVHPFRHVEQRRLRVKVRLEAAVLCRRDVRLALRLRCTRPDGLDPVRGGRKRLEVPTVRTAFLA